MKVSNTEQIPAIFVMANFEKDQLWRGHSSDLVTAIKQFNDEGWRFDQLHQDYHECIELLYWKKVDPASLEHENANLKMLTTQELRKLIDGFNPEWEDLYDTLVPKDPNPQICPHCGEEIYAQQHSVLTTDD